MMHFSEYSCFLQILGFMIVVVLFGLMRQSSAWERDCSVPSLLSAVESNLKLSSPLMFLCFAPILLFLAFLLLTTGQNPRFGTFLFVTVICYIVANGFTILLILSSKLILYVAAILYVFVKRRLVQTKYIFLIHISLYISSVVFVTMQILFKS
jgi:hypothetical protein